MFPSKVIDGFLLACRYVLPSNAIFRLANAPNPPTDLPSLFKIVSLTTIRNRAQELLDVLTTAKLPASLASLASLAVRRPEIANESLHVQDAIALSNGPGLAPLMPDLWGTSRSSGNVPSQMDALRPPTNKYDQLRMP